MCAVSGGTEEETTASVRSQEHLSRERMTLEVGGAIRPRIPSARFRATGEKGWALWTYD